MQTASATGFFGKLPCKGDFLQQRVTQEFVDTWDAWLQQCMFASREQLQERWLDTYLTSPVWRFALADGVCGSGAYVGLMVPSVDRVGRYFPLALVAQLSAEDCLLEVVTSKGAQQWFEAAEALALGALEAHDLDLLAFDEQVAALQGLQQREPEAVESAHLRALLQTSPFGQRPGQWHLPLQTVASLQRAANVFASRELERTLRPLSLWWTDGSNVVAPCWLSNRGLPAPSSFAGMMAGDWDRCGWESLGPPAPVVSTPEEVLEPQVAAEPVATEPIAMVAYHTDLVRQQSSAPRGHFVSRPEIGLWGFSCSDGQEASKVAAQTVADLLHDTSTAGSLSALVEAVRYGLEAIQRQGATSAVYSKVAAAGAVVFLMRANECAVICAGAVQAVRARAREVTTIEGESHTDEIVIHYDTLRAGDLWVLAGSLLIDDQVLAKFPALLAQSSAIATPAVVDVQRFWAQNSGVDENELPLMLLAASGVRTGAQPQ
jgi:type VI secretion system protein ImpM